MKHLLIVLLLLLSTSVMGQEAKRYSAVNPALLLYKPQDVYIKPPVKFQNGKNIISPNPTLYPWEEDLDNGMPNVVMDENKNLSIYISGFITPSPKAPSRVGAQVYTNNTNNILSWQRPSAGLYWYNPQATTTDTKIVGMSAPGYLPTNIVAVDIESMGIYEDTEVTNKPLKLIYKPQRESNNDLIAAYEMNKQFNNLGILQDFYSMKNDRLTKQQKMKFKFIHGDTHMNYIKQNGEYYLVTRLNSKRSALKKDETLPLSPDKRERFRRTAISKIGPQIVTQNSDFQIALEMSTVKWEPYSMQPYRLPKFENDIWWGLVTMFGFEGFPETEAKQRTELAISTDGVHWRYLKPGIPFIDNGTDSASDDYGCINVAKPIMGTKFSQNNDLLFFYAASNIRHVHGRNPGISMASSTYGKVAGIQADATPKVFYSLNPKDDANVSEEDMIQYSISKAFGLDNEFYPYVLGDITVDPTGKSIEQMTSYVYVVFNAYNSANPHGIGSYLAGSFGSSKPGTTQISDEYNAIPLIRDGLSGNNKGAMLKYLKRQSELKPQQIISIKDYPTIPIVVETRMKNAVYYGMELRQKSGDDTPAMIAANASNYAPKAFWNYIPDTPVSPCHTVDFSTTQKLPNQKLPTEKEMGSIALKVMPKQSAQEQTVLRMYGTDRDYLGIYYTPSGSFQYKIVKAGTEFATMLISPPMGKSFNNKEVVITFEAVKSANRKYGSSFQEEASVFRVYCPGIGVDTEVQQDVLWNWKHTSGSITPVDSANARGFAYLNFSAFVAGMDKISIGGENTSCNKPFTGSIYNVEVADKLPSGGSDFWTNGVNALSRSNGVTEFEEQSEIENSLSIYPNPVADVVNIRLSLSEEQHCDIYIVDVSGVKLKKLSSDFFTSGEHHLNIDISSLKKGLYFLLCENSKGVSLAKFMKK